MLEDSQFFAMLAPPTRSRLGIHIVEKLSLNRLHPPVQCPVCPKCSTQAAGGHSYTRGRSPKDLDKLLPMDHYQGQLSSQKRVLTRMALP